MEVNGGENPPLRVNEREFDVRKGAKRGGSQE